MRVGVLAVSVGVLGVVVRVLRMSVLRHLSYSELVRLGSPFKTKLRKLSLTLIHTNDHTTLEVREIKGRRPVSGTVGRPDHTEKDWVVLTKDLRAVTKKMSLRSSMSSIHRDGSSRTHALNTARIDRVSASGRENESTLGVHQTASDGGLFDLEHSSSG